MSRSRFACVVDIGTELEVDTPANITGGEIRITIGGIDDEGEIISGQQVTLDWSGIGGLIGVLMAYKSYRDAALASLVGAVPSASLERKAGALKRKAKGQR